MSFAVFATFRRFCHTKLRTKFPLPVLPGQTFLDTQEPPHLWVVLAGPDAEAKVIIANFTSVKGRDDRTTVCNAGEHPFIVRESVVAYKYAMHIAVAEIEKALANGVFVAREDCAEELLAKIADGLLASNSTPLGIQNAYIGILRS